MLFYSYFDHTVLPFLVQQEMLQQHSLRNEYFAYSDGLRQFPPHMALVSFKTLLGKAMNFRYNSYFLNSRLRMIFLQ